MKASVAVLFPLLLAPALPAQQPLRFAPAFRNYTTDQGLPNNWVYDIYQDRTGYIWVATDHGVCRFNGYTFEQFPDTLYTNLTSVMTGAMTEDERGRLWYVDFQSRVFYIENGRIHPYAFNAVIAANKGPIDFFHGLMVEGNGADVWLVGRIGGLLHLDRTGRCERLQPPAAGLVFEVFERQGRYQMSAIASVADTFSILFQHSSGRKWLRYPNFRYDILQSGYFQVRQLRDKRWCFYYWGRLFLLDEDAVLWWRPYDKAPAAILQEPGGALLVGHIFKGGLDRYRSLEELRAGRVEDHYLDGLSVSCILRDREGGYWIGTQQAGIFYCPDWNGNVLASPAYLNGVNIRSMASDGRNRLYAGLQDGRVFELDLAGQQVRDISLPDLPFLSKITYNQTTQTLGLAGDYMALYRQGRWRRPTFYAPQMGMRYKWSGIYLSASPTDGHWLGCNYESLFRLTPERPLLLDLAMAGRFYAVCQRRCGDIWAASAAGLQEWKGGAVLRPPALRHPALLQSATDVRELPDSSLVFCPKGHGVVLWKPGESSVTEIGLREGLLSAKVNALHIGSGGTIWACSHLGLSKLTPLGGRRYRVDNYTVQHGLPSNTVNDVAETSDGNVWVATAKGLFRLRGKPVNAPVPGPLFVQALVNNTAYAPAALGALPHDSANIALEYVLLYYRSGGDIPYRFRLLAPGADTSWTLTRQRKIYFANLAPKAYRFDVQAQDEDGRWSPVSRLAFVIRPPWYARWWARTAAALALAFLVYAGYRYRVRQIRRENRLTAEMLRLERSALQAQMNPHFIFNCLASIQQFILCNEPDNAVFFLAKFAKLVRSTLQASVAGEISLEDELRLLDNYLALEQMRFGSRFTYAIHSPEGLDGRQILLPPLLVQPFVENAVLHGMKGKTSGGRIEVVFQLEGATLRIEVRDNGAGMQPAAHTAEHRSFGAEITQRRLALLQQQNARLAIAVEYQTPADGTGTWVVLRVPVEKMT